MAEGRRRRIKVKKFARAFYNRRRKMIEIELLTIAEVAQFLKLSKRTVHRLTVTRQLPGGFKVGGQWRFNQVTIKKYVDEQERKVNGEC
jgi:excisionase family DNA binding protein